MISLIIRKVVVTIGLIGFICGEVAPAVAADSGVGSGFSMGGKGGILQIIKSVSRKFGIDPLLVEAVVKVESDYNPLAVSAAGAEGLMQIVPETQRELGVIDAFDPNDNLRGGVRYLVKLITRFHDVRTALLAYHSGLGRIQSGNVPTSSRRYANRVLKIYWALKRATSANQAPR